MRLHRDVERLIRDHGYSVAFSRASSGGTYDTETGTIVGGSNLSWVGRGVFVSYNTSNIDGTTIKMGDRKLLLQARGLDREPVVGDVVNDTIMVVAVQKIQSGETVIGYVCQVRG